MASILRKPDAPVNSLHPRLSAPRGPLDAWVSGLCLGLDGVTSAARNSPTGLFTFKFFDHIYVEIPVFG
jgi:hypothetical protein